MTAGNVVWNNKAGFGTRRGFTLLELVIALAILALLVTMAAPVVQLQIQRQKETELRAALRDIRNAIDAYKRAADSGRIAKAADASGYPARLEVLVDGVSDLRDPKARPLHFLRRIPRDPLLSDASLSAVQTWGQRSSRSPPSEPAAGDDVFDIFSLSSRKAINGTPYREW